MAISKKIPSFGQYRITEAGVVTDSLNLGAVVPQFTDDDGIVKVVLPGMFENNIVSVATLLWETWNIGLPDSAGDNASSGGGGGSDPAELIDPILGSNIDYFVFDKDPPDTTFLKANIERLEFQPYDGVVFELNTTDSLPGIGLAGASSNKVSINCWTNNIVTVNGLAASAAEYNTTNNKKFKNNFALMTMQVSETLNQPPVDWFDPLRGEPTFATFEAVAATLATMPGAEMFFNMEPDNTFAGPFYALFKYSNRPFAADHTFEEYEEEAYRWGQQLVRRMQKVNPTMILMLSFGYRQAAADQGTAQADRNYGLLKRFKDGMNDARISTFKIHDWYEDGYNYATQAAWDNGVSYVDDPNQFFDADNQVSERHDEIRGGVIMLDYPVSAVYDTVTLSNNYWTPAKLATAIPIALNTFSQRFFGFRSEDIKSLTVPPTVPAAITEVIRASRIPLGKEEAFDPALVANLFFDPDPDTLIPLGDAAPISTLTDSFGHAFTSTGSLRPTVDLNAFGTGICGINFVAATLQKLICDAIAAEIWAAATADGGYSFLIPMKLTTASGATFTLLSFGRAATTNPVVSAHVTSGSAFASQRQDDAGSSTAVSGGTATTATTIFGVVSNGITCSLYANGALVATNVTQDKGAMTFDQFTLGALRINTLSNFMGGKMGRPLGYKGALGHETMKWLSRGLGAKYGATIVA